MNSRERILRSLQHKEPDRVPVDLGGMDSTGIVGIAYNRLKNHIGIKDGKTQIFDPYQQVVKGDLSNFALFFVSFQGCLSGMGWNIAQNWVEFMGVSEKIDAVFVLNDLTNILMSLNRGRMVS